MTAIRHFRKERKKAENSSSLESVLYKFTLPSVPKRGREEEHIDPPAWRVSTQAPTAPARAGLSVDGIIFTMIPSLVSSVAARVPAASPRLRARSAPFSFAPGFIAGARARSNKLGIIL